MAQVSTQQINVSHLMVALFFMMLAAGAFVVIVTSTLVNSQVSALSGRLAAQNNPVTVTPAAQTNVAPGAACVDPTVPADDEGHVLGASTGDGSAVLALASRAVRGGHFHPLASVSYSQSNTSTTNTSSTNTYVKDSHNSFSSSREFSSVIVANNGNTRDSYNDNSDHRHSGNDNSSSTTTTTKTVTIQDNGNTQDNSTHSSNTQAWNNDNTNNSGNDNSQATTTTTSTSDSHNDSHDNNSVNTDGGLF